MNTKPCVMEKLHTTNTAFVVDFEFPANIVLVAGDSGQGKSACYSFIAEAAVLDSRIICYNYLDLNRDYASEIRNSSGKLFVIDNADLLLNDELRKYICFDTRNQYLLFGRNPGNLLTTKHNLLELDKVEAEDRIIFNLKQLFE